MTRAMIAPMTTTLTYTGQLVVTTCWCGMRHAVPQELINHQRKEHNDGRPMTSIYCPLGHSWVLAGDGKAVHLQRQLDETAAQLTATRDQLAAAEREARRHAKRAAAGVCPCCKRSFVQLARHMRGQHPDYSTR